MSKTETTRLQKLKELSEHLLSLDSESGEGKLVAWAASEIESLEEEIKGVYQQAAGEGL